ncbi:reverse transcriptase [Senna tora]|uniref:Reverse transcriptase n=1 Tax=Senna tora TaxID=362788 RepID=A0A834WI59_9FABA|nr:reverse transcriptase [Senna tora]
MRRLNGINNSLQNGHNPWLVKLEQELAREFQNVLLLEEELWASKSRVEWLHLGDSNTLFFHSSFIEIRRSNCILSLQDHNGNWLYNPVSIKDHISEYFLNCFSFSPVTNLDQNLPFPSIPSAGQLSLNDISTPTEIKNALLNLKPYKAPGVDGFQAAFFQKYWDFLNIDIMPCIQHIFSSKTMPPNWNDTIICLIPKIQNPTKVKNFCPISLCNTLYKLVSKVLVNRIKPFLPNLISENQAAFIKGRKANDNIILANEIIHSYNRKRSRKFGWLIISLDLEKAYDRLNWSFISSVLLKMNFPAELVSLISACISSVSHQFLINGTLTHKIIPSRGIRQGDPLSPYIFICCMQYLSSLIDVQVHKKKWVPPKLRGTPLSHLLFADDVLLFARVDVNSISAIKRTIEKFLTCSGLSINRSKSSIWFSDNTPMDMRNTALRNLNFSAVNNPSRYLGYTLGTKGKHNDFVPLINKIQSRINCWSNKYLSFAGKTTLINSVLSLLITYHTNTVALPTKTSKLIDKTLRDFFWSAPDDKKKIHTISWEKICIPTSFLSLIAKLACQVNSQQNSLWSNSIRHYLNPTCNSFSTTGKAIRKGLSLISSNSSSIISNGKNTDHWFDNWFTKAPLKNDDSIKVNVFANDLGSWSWELLSFDLPLSIKDSINAIPCLKNAPSANFIIVRWVSPPDGWWKLNSDGACSGNPDPFAIGGIIRDHFDNWIMGLSGFVGYGNALKAELWAIASGIKVAISLRCNHLWIESDSLLACKSALRNFTDVKLSHTFREGNQCADQLAKLSLLNREAYIVHQDIPPFLKMYFLADLHGVTFDRITASFNFASLSSLSLVCNVISSNLARS